MPIISVILPVYNRTSQLKAAVASVLKQTEPDYELLIIDDGSYLEIGKFIIPDKRIKLFRQKNKGVSSARNYGIKQARGKYIAFLDSDDIWLPDKLEKQRTFMEQHPDYLISQTEDIWMRNGRRVNPHKKHRKKSGNIFMESLELCLISPSAVIMKKELFERVGYFDESLPACEDYDLWLRIAKDYPVGLLNEPLIVRYAGHADQLSLKYPVMDRFRLKSLKKILNLLPETDQRRSSVSAIIKKKSGIIAQGAWKRGRLFTWLYYRYMV